MERVTDGTEHTKTKSTSPLCRVGMNERLHDEKTTIKRKAKKKKGKKERKKGKNGKKQNRRRRAGSVQSPSRRGRVRSLLSAPASFLKCFLFKNKKKPLKVDSFSFLFIDFFFGFHPPFTVCRIDRIIKNKKKYLKNILKKSVGCKICRVFRLKKTKPTVFPHGHVTLTATTWAPHRQSK